MTIEELQTKLGSLLKNLPASGFDTIADTTIGELGSLAAEAENLGMKSGKSLISNLIEVFKTRKAGGNTDESVHVRLTALDFYVKSLQNGATEDL